MMSQHFIQDDHRTLLINRLETLGFIRLPKSTRTFARVVARLVGLLCFTTGRVLHDQTRLLTFVLIFLLS